MGPPRLRLSIITDSARGSIDPFTRAIIVSSRAIADRLAASEMLPQWRRVTTATYYEILTA